eukprot:403365311
MNYSNHSSFIIKETELQQFQDVDLNKIQIGQTYEEQYQEYLEQMKLQSMNQQSNFIQNQNIQIQNPEELNDVNQVKSNDIDLEKNVGIQSEKQVAENLQPNHNQETGNEFKVQQKIKVSFHDLQYSVQEELTRKQRKEKGGQKTVTKEILKTITGYALPGEATYIIGSSGSGKTTLLNMICDRIIPKKEIKMKRKVLMNDTTPLDIESFSKVGAYVMQDDVFFEYFTPREALRFAARLKLNISKDLQDKRVEKVLDDLGLTAVADSQIGGMHAKVLSGGEKKRTAIGIALITDPIILLLDEPTSGLDSFKALQIVKLLNKQASYGRTVLATIHQPSTQSFYIFERLILMTDGNVIYEGKPQDSVKYFKQIGFHVPKFSNPSDYFMSRILTVEYPKSEFDEKKLEFLKQQFEEHNKPEILQTIQDVKLDSVNQDLLTFHVSKKGQLKQLMRREFIGLYRNPQHLRVKVLRQIIVGLLVLAIFFGLDGTDRLDVQGLTGCLFFIAVNQTMMLVFSSLIVFQEERPMFLREYAQQMYGIPAYFFCKVIVEIPLNIIQTYIFSFIVYWGIGTIASFWLFLRFSFVILTLEYVAAGFGYFISSLFRNTETAVLFVPVFMMPLMLLGGFFSNVGNTMEWILWLQYVSPIRYGAEALIQNEFSNRVLPPGLNPLVFLNFNLGYWFAMVLLVTLGCVLMIFSLFNLKFRISRPQ